MSAAVVEQFPANLSAALFLASLGIPIIPVHPRSKVPLIARWPEEATTDPAKIRYWYAQSPDANIGIRTGVLPDGRELVAFDADVDYATGKDGRETLADLAATPGYGSLPDTWVGLTPTGGRHLPFIVPAGSNITNDRGRRLGPDVDIRGIGGFIVVASSIHPNGGEYQWEDGYGPGDLPIANLPQPYVDLLAKPDIRELAQRERAPRHEGDLRLPGHALDEQKSWPALLEPQGGSLVGRRVDHATGEYYELWARPGVDHASASLYYRGSNVLKVFSSNWPGLDQGQTYTKLGFIAYTRFGGDFSAARSWLESQGFHGDLDPRQARFIVACDALRPPGKADPWPAWMREDPAMLQARAEAIEWRAAEQARRLAAEAAEIAGQLREQADRAARGEAVDVPPVNPAGEEGGYLRIRWSSEVAADLANRPRRQWLFNRVWPADAYGVMGAAPKVGKTFLLLDAAVSVVTATPFLGLWDVERSGNALVLLGEGGSSKMLRRGRAVARARGQNFDDLAIAMSERVPHLTNREHLDELQRAIERVRPVLIGLDPLYLAAPGADMRNLYSMGEVLERAQTIAQAADCALIVVHHHNRNENAKGADRFSGAGPQEWGRSLISVTAENAEINKETGRSDIKLIISFTGDEIAGGEYRVMRSIWADDPDDLNSDLNYSTTVLDDGRPGSQEPTIIMKAISDLLGNSADPMTQDRIMKNIHMGGMTTRLVALQRLVDLGHVARIEGPRHAQLHSLIRPYSGVPEAFTATIRGLRQPVSNGHQP